jgi:hypothetical protein
MAGVFVRKVVSGDDSVGLAFVETGVSTPQSLLK